MLWVGIGCGGLLVLGVAAGIASYFYMKSQVSAAETAIAAAASASPLGTALPAPTSMSPACAKAVACCQAVMNKTGGANAAAGAQACNGIGLLSEELCQKQYEGQKRAATVVGATCP